LKICTPTGQIQTQETISGVYGILGDVKVLNSSLTLVSDTTGQGTLDSTGNFITLSVANPNYVEGEEIYLVVDGYRTKNIVSGVGANATYKLHKQVVNFDSEAVTTTRINKRYNVTMNEGKYYLLPNNEILVVRLSWNNPLVGFSDLATDFPDIINFEEWELNSLNKVALNDVYSDLRGFDNVYDIVWATNIYTLLKAKILSKLQNRFRTQDGIDFHARYSEELKKFSVEYQKSETDQGTPESAEAFVVKKGKWSF
jgi:hypothetical protein